MSLFFKITTAAALGLLDECRNDDADVVTFNDTPEVGAAGGAETSPNDSAPDTQQTDVNADAAAAKGAAVEDDDDDPDLKEDAHRGKPWEHDPDFKRSMNKTRTLQRKLAKYRPIVEKVRAFGIADKLDDVVNNARRYSDAEPTLRQIARGGGESSRAADGDQSRDYQPPAFDRKSVPFDDSVPEGKFLIDLAEAQHNNYHRIVGVIQAIVREVNRSGEERQGEVRARETNEWKSDIETAAQQLPESVNGLPIRMMFSDAVKGIFHQAKVRGQRVNRKDVIAHYLKNYKAGTTDPAVTAATQQQRIAEANKKRPSSGAFRGGTPTGARDISNERVSDVSRRLVGRRYLGPR